MTKKERQVKKNRKLLYQWKKKAAIPRIGKRAWRFEKMTPAARLKYLRKRFPMFCSQIYGRLRYGYGIQDTIQPTYYLALIGAGLAQMLRDDPRMANPLRTELTSYAMKQYEDLTEIMHFFLESHPDYCTMKNEHVDRRIEKFHRGFDIEAEDWEDAKIKERRNEIVKYRHDCLIQAVEKLIQAQEDYNL